MKQILKAGVTSKTLVIFIQDSSKTTGVGLTGLTNASAGLSWYYYREAAGADVAVVLANETLGTWTSGGFVQIDATHLPGFYEIGVPNAALAAGANSVFMQLQGAANMVPVNIEIELVAYDPTNGTNLGLTALPGTAAASTGGLPTIGVGAGNIDLDSTGRVDVSKWLGTAVTAATGGVPDVNVKNYNNVAAATDANNLPKVDTEDWKGTAVSLPATAGIPDVNVKNYNNVAAATDVNSLPKVDVEDFHGTAVTMSGSLPEVAVGTNLDKTGYTLTQTFPTNFASLAITSAGAVTLNSGQITVKKDQALAGFTFPMFSSTTGSLITGLTVTAQRSIDGGSVTTCANAVAEVGSGIYKLDLAATDLNGNSITVILTATGAFDSAFTFVTQP
jgi:hypothetical protein